MRSSKLNQQIILKQQKNRISLEFDWDEELKSEINALSPDDRQWHNPYHVSFPIDCVDIVRSFSQKIAARNGWEFYDLIANSNSAITDQKVLAASREHHYKTAAFIELLKKFGANRQLYIAQGYRHELDEFLQWWHKQSQQTLVAFVEVLDRTISFMDVISSEIESSKEKSALLEQQRVRANADCIAQPLLPGLEKQQLLDLAIQHGVSIRKSWTKDKLREAIAPSSKFRAIALQLLELKEED